jgi:hypothetical protein
MFENRILRSVFGSERDEVMEGWRKRQNEELHNLYSSHNFNVYFTVFTHSTHVYSDRYIHSNVKC